jgi:N-acyl-D-aspartate/D-glutamate deacylase
MPSKNGADSTALLLRGGTVIDGSGAPRFAADVRIEGERIVAVGPNLAQEGADVLDIGSLIVAPGFIDVHTHDDQIVLSAPHMLPKVSQGVTTVVVGNCGISLAPLVHSSVPPPLNLLGGTDKYVYPTMAAYVAAIAAARPAVNVAALVGHSTLRVATMDDPYRPATPAEQSRMCELLREDSLPVPPDSAPACTTPPAPPPTSTSWRCWPASPAPRAVSTRRTSARKWTRSWIRSTRPSPPPDAAR